MEKMSHGIVSQAVYSGVQISRDPAVGPGCFHRGSDRALEVSPNLLHRWRSEFRQGPGNAFPGYGQRRWSEGRIAELERKIGQQTLEIDFLKGCLQRIEEQRMLQVSTGSPRSTGKSVKK